ncbi:MAG TPA: alpha/beta hydrolase [Candidatus Methylomirabilis sp.]|nr:alpha/beta hydrolase [Candidatus Methylomirabilis sp.]
MLRALLLSLGLVAVSPSLDEVAPAADDLVCNQEPGNRFFWVERAFCDLELAGPGLARGIVIWNHGISGTAEQWRAPAPLAFRLLQARGWDVIAIKRHNLAETAVDRSLYRAVERTLEEVRRQRARGYRRVVLAGQSFGGYITLDAAEQSSDLFAVIAMAPGVRSSGADGRLDPSITERSLMRVKTERVALVLPKDDALFGFMVRGERANRILSARPLSYLLIDELSGISGHGGAMGGRFALRYGSCLDDFLSTPTLPAGRFVCPPIDESSVIRQLLLPDPRTVRFLEDPSAAPPRLGYLVGRWYALLDDTLILFGMVDGPSPARVWFQWTTVQSGGGRYDAQIADTRISFTLPEGARVVVEPGSGDPLLTWTSADGKRVTHATLIEMKGARSAR